MTIPEKLEGTAADDATLRLWLRLLSCTMTIEKRVQRDLVDNFDTTLARFDVLAALDRHPDGLTMSALSQLMLVSNGNATQLVQKAARDGLVAVAPAPGDRRSSIVSLTPAGRANFDTLATAHRGWIGALFAGLDGDERVALDGLLGRLKSSIAAAAQEGRR